MLQKTRVIQEETKITQSQLTCGRLSTPESSVSGHYSDSSFSEEKPFCLQMKIQDKKAHTSVPVPKHLVTNLEFKVKPHKRKTKFLQARVDRCRCEFNASEHIQEVIQR